MLGQPAPSPAAVKAVSTDGEATVYLTSDFSREFYLGYTVTLRPAPTNKSWSTVSILLLGSAAPSGSVAVGISRGSPDAATLAGFTMSNALGKPPILRTFTVDCGAKCLLEMSGDATTIAASVGGRRVGVWARQSLSIVSPTVQINAEVAEVGDRISARAAPVRSVSGGHIQRPACAFTTQGVEPKLSGDGTIEFEGSRRQNARVTYLSLATGATGDRLFERKRAQSPVAFGAG